MDVILWNATTGHEGNIPTRYIGPYKINHWIKKYGYTGQVIEFIVNLTEQELYNLTKKFMTPKTMVLGISTTFLTRLKYTWKNGTEHIVPEHVYNVLSRLKQEFPTFKIVLGGYNAQNIYFNLADAVIMSYTEASEDIFIEYLDYLRKGTNPPIYKELIGYPNLPKEITGSKNFRRIPYYYSARTKKYNIESDDFMFTKNDGILINEALPLDISRGCIFACRFCKYPHLGRGKLDYTRGMDYVKTELLHNYNAFGTTNYMILDDTFNDTEIKMQAFHTMVKTLPFEINYSAYLRADLIHRFQSMGPLLQDSGLWGAFHGLESLHPTASLAVGKGWSGKHAKEYIPKLYHDIWSGKIPMVLSFIAGLPDETYDDIIDTLKWGKENNLYSMYYGPLGLNDPRKNLYAITSEFERNSEKYGFKFNVDGTWYNNVWSLGSLLRTMPSIYKYIRDNRLRKTCIWNVGNMRMLGFSKDYLLNTAYRDINHAEVTRRSKEKFKEYYDMVINL